MKKKIMVVDDEPDVAFTVEFSLKDTDCEVIKVENGEKCLEILEKSDTNPDLILLDIMLPGLSGWEIFKKLKENPSWEKIPVIFLTARVDHTAENTDDFLGDDYIEKPYDPDDLRIRIQRVLNEK